MIERGVRNAGTSGRRLGWRLLSVAFRSSERAGFPCRTGELLDDPFYLQRENARNVTTLCHVVNTYPAGLSWTYVGKSSKDPATR